MSGQICGICDEPAVSEIAPGKPVCAACLALPLEERRLAGLRRMAANGAKRADLALPVVRRRARISRRLLGEGGRLL